MISPSSERLILNLSKILANPKHVPKEERFINEMISAFNHAQHDDKRIRQYLALAMGRSGDKRFLAPLIENLPIEKEANLASIIYALGMLKDEQSAEYLYEFVEHPNSRIRSISIVALGNIANPNSIHVIKKGLYDSEVNVQWGAAISLAQLGDGSGENILSKLLDRNYLSQFTEVDRHEADQLILKAIESVGQIKNQSLMLKVKELSTSDKNMNVRNKALEILNQ